LLRQKRASLPEPSRPALIRALTAAPPPDVAWLLSESSRLGLDFALGGVAVVARAPADERLGPKATLLAEHPTALLAELTPGRLAGLVPGSSPDTADAVIGDLEALGLECTRSDPRRDPADLHEAMREAELMLELRTSAAGQEETYRLLVGVLLRDVDKIELLRAQTTSPLSDYDSRHDTELLATLSAFLAHHGSTSETAEAMGLHRHTVGYRLARVHEVSGLSPYESDGRERLSLGLKAHQILEAEERLAARC
jgi:purine catabolism regulator